MPTLVCRRHPTAHPAATGTAADLPVAEPRDDVVAETGARPGPDGTLVFGLAHGPFRSYERVLRALPDGGTEETIRYRLAVPYWGFVYALPVRRALRRGHLPGLGAERQPWWAPPQRLDARAAAVLGTLATVSLLVGYLNTLLTQTVTFAGDEFGVSSGSRGVALALVRSAVIIAVGFALLADRRGRRLALLAGATVAPVAAALGAASPSFAALTLTQMVSRPVALATSVLIGVVVAEEMPRGARAYAIGLVGMATGLGAGLCVVALPLADLGERGWRLVYLVPLALMVLLPGIARRLPETHRFRAAETRAGDTWAGDTRAGTDGAGGAPPPGRRAIHHHLRGHGGRFWMVALTGLCTNLLVAPASGFQNQFLADERGFSAGRIALFTLLTATPAGVGILGGGRMADARGRRMVGAIAVACNAVGTVMTFRSDGAPMWLWALMQSVLGAAALPALGVYGAELFPTAARSLSASLITVLSLVGSSAGLLATGALLDAGWSFGAVMTLMAIGPVLTVALVLTRFPETARTELEDLNPEDRRPPPG